MNLDARKARRGLHHLDDPSRHCLGRIVLGALRNNQHELIPTQASDGIDLAHNAFEALCHLAQEFITHSMSKGIVYHLEAVEIQHNNGKCLVLAVGKRDALADAVLH